MSIDFQCPSCNDPFHVPEEMAVTRARCNRCGFILTVPHVPVALDLGRAPSIENASDPLGAFADPLQSTYALKKTETSEGSVGIRVGFVAAVLIGLVVAGVTATVVYRIVTRNTPTLADSNPQMHSNPQIHSICKYTVIRKYTVILKYKAR